jgi:type IV secretion system protein VirB11
MSDSLPAARIDIAARGADMLAAALGAEIRLWLEAPDTLEILANPDGWVFLEREGIGRARTQLRLPPSGAERIIRLAAGLCPAPQAGGGLIVTAELPPHGDRFEGLLPPVVRAPCFAIRRPTRSRPSLEDYVRAGILSPTQASQLRAAIAGRANILIAGGAGSGKTTLANALLAEMARRSERIVVLEDTRELGCDAEDIVHLRTLPGQVSLNDLVRSTLRLRPDRIIVGEVRGGEALELLKAWNTGHPGGLATLHANSAEAALSRLEQLTLEVASTPPTRLIEETIDLVTFIERGGPGGRIVSQILVPSRRQSTRSAGSTRSSLTQGRHP